MHASIDFRRGSRVRPSGKFNRHAILIGNARVASDYMETASATCADHLRVNLKFICDFASRELPSTKCSTLALSPPETVARLKHAESSARNGEGESTARVPCTRADNSERNREI